MLELPEVEVLKKDLEKEVVGKRVKDVMVETASIVRPYHRTRPDFVKALEGRRIEAVRRRGAALFLDLDEDQTWIIDPGENGTLLRETATADIGDDTHLAVTFTIGGAIHLIDTSKDPTSHTGVVATGDALAEAGIEETSMDPLDDNPTWMEFARLMKHHAMPMKQLLTDRSVMLGLGPVYSDEILWEAGLAHDRQSETLSTQEVRRFYRAMQEVIAAAIKYRGSTLEDASPDSVVDEEGETAEHIKVYGRDGLPCHRCRSTLVKERLSKGVYTYHCGRCQM
ncbi:MAG TPA: DNA-formamidopyrimidine glycosylase family protein [Nitriliruptorales bacterium]